MNPVTEYGSQHLMIDFLKMLNHLHDLLLIVTFLMTDVLGCWLSLHWLAIPCVCYNGRYTGSHPRNPGFHEGGSSENPAYSYLLQESW